MINKKRVCFEGVYNILDAAAANADTANVPDKYLPLKYARFSPIYDVMQQMAIERPRARVLDFGCGTGMATVIGDACGLRVTGMDIDHYEVESTAKIQRVFKREIVSNMPLPYADLLRELGEAGYDFQVFNTNEFPWSQFQDDEFDYIYSNWAFDSNFVRLEREPIVLQGIYRNRVAECLRISKSTANWYISPESMRAKLKASGLLDDSDIQLRKIIA